MSGGSFDYAYCRTERFAAELGERLDDPYKVDKNGYEPNFFEAATLTKLREIERLARYVSQLMKEAEWLYSADTSDDSFMERVRKIEAARGTT